MLILGIILLLLGWLTGIGILYALGTILVVVGVVLMLLSGAGRPVAGRRWY
jgi:hypothetical protein